MVCFCPLKSSFSEINPVPWSTLRSTVASATSRLRGFAAHNTQDVEFDAWASHEPGGDPCIVEDNQDL